MKTNKEFIIEYCNALSGNPKTEELLDKYISDKDPELKGHIILFEGALPCYEFIPEDVIAEGNKVMVRFLVKGKHEGFLFGYNPTGNEVKITGIIVYEVAENMIVNHWMQADSVGLIEQISKPAFVMN